ncbi:pyridoxamine 5'-phosphate oxidase family protein [Microbacterium rhizophilus]|uniref:pyridoxamine 5'-phosphate oxidase family protein n=1 Tax=Microbacterium rhizophilus TaxID=3138934 RepID=UPI0031E97653
MATTGTADDHREIEELTTAECWRLVESRDVARLAVTHGDGAPDIFPLNYVAHRGNLYIRSGAGRKLRSMAARPAVALEVDGEDDDFYWSVVVRGAASQIEADSEILASGAAHLISHDPSHKPHVVRIVPAGITGRRFAKRAPGEVAAEAPHHGAPRADAPGRPTPIPHFPPTW